MWSHFKVPFTGYRFLSKNNRFLFGNVSNFGVGQWCQKRYKKVSRIIWIAPYGNILKYVFLSVLTICVYIFWQKELVQKLLIKCWLNWSQKACFDCGELSKRISGFRSWLFWVNIKFNIGQIWTLCCPKWSGFIKWRRWTTSFVHVSFLKWKTSTL